MSNLLLSGPPRYRARGTWPPLAALVAVVVIQAGLQLLGGVLGALVAGVAAPLAPGLPDEQRLMLAVLVFLALSQVAVIALAWWAAGFFGGERRAVLQLDTPKPGVRDVVVALAGLTLVLGAFNGLVYFFRPDLFMADVAPFLPMMQWPLWPVTALAVGLGAPLSEEVLFRGFLISSLASRMPGGFWPAALLANAVWTAFHLGYSVAGLLEVFLGGLCMSWLLWRSGSLWLPIIAHAATNIFFLAVIAVYPFQ